MRRIYNVLKSLMIASGGLFLGEVLFDYLNYRLHPEAFEMASIPWYTSVISSGIFAGTVIIACFIARLVIGHELGKK